MEDAAYWLFLHGLLSLLSYTSQDHMLRGSTAHSELVPPISIINQENDPMDLPVAQSDGGTFSVEVPSS